MAVIAVAAVMQGRCRIELIPMSAKESEPRRHHYVPRCWLAGFTETGEKDGKLWVTDIVRRKQWESSPGGTGFIRDFYRLSDDELDPVMVERALSEIEGAVAPLLKSVDQERRLPGREEFQKLLYFVAIQWARVPSFRPLVFKMFESVTREELAKALKSEESWEKTLQEARIAEDAPGAEYESMLEFERSGKFNITVQTEWYIQQMFRAAEQIFPTLQKRNWNQAISPTGSFIGCDSPVILEGPKEQMMGFRNAELITYALSRYVLLYSTLEESNLFVNRKFIAHVNTLSLRRAEQRVFSHVPDFCWHDENRKYQTDWTQFSKEKY
jgi:hypothetical protein